MLVISRRIDEKIVIGDNIVITIVDMERGKVRIGVEAPREIPVFRSELLDRTGVDGVEKAGEVAGY